MVKSIKVYEEEDVIKLALTLTDNERPCSGGKYCPRCRIALAVGKLTSEYGLPFDWGDGMITMLCLGMKHKDDISKEEADEILRDAI